MYSFVNRQANTENCEQMQKALFIQQVTYFVLEQIRARRYGQKDYYPTSNNSCKGPEI